MKTAKETARGIVCSVQIQGGGEKTAKELLVELLLQKAKNLTCDKEKDKI